MLNGYTLPLDVHVQHHILPQVTFRSCVVGPEDCLSLDSLNVDLHCQRADGRVYQKQEN